MITIIACTVYGFLLGVSGTLWLCAHLDVKRARRTAAETKAMAE